jgi:hypothetical protein
VEEAVDPRCVEVVRRPGIGDLRAGLHGLVLGRRRQGGWRETWCAACRVPHALAAPPRRSFFSLQTMAAKASCSSGRLVRLRPPDMAGKIISRHGCR